MTIPRTDTVVALIRQCFEEGWEVSYTRPILADAMEDAGYVEHPYGQFLKKLRSPVFVTVPKDEFLEALAPIQLAGCDWQHAFAYAGEPDAGDGSASLKAAHPGKDIDLSPFSRWDVAEVFATSEGVQDETNWLCYGRLKDGRFFFLTAGCDYTGWGCQEWGDVNIGATREEVVRFGMGPDDRKRLGCELTEEYP